MGRGRSPDCELRACLWDLCSADRGREMLLTSLLGKIVMEKGLGGIEKQKKKI